MHCQILDLLKSTAKFRNAWYMQILQSLSTHVQVHSQHFFSKYIASVQSNCIVFCQKCFEIPAFCKYLKVHVYKNH